MENRYNNFKYKHKCKYYHKKYYHNYTTNHHNIKNVQKFQYNSLLNYNYNKLPSVVLQKIYLNLNLKDLLNASSVCYDWRLCLYDPLLWQQQTMYVNLITKNDIQSATYKINSFGSFLKKLIINYNPNDFILLNELEKLFESLTKLAKSLRQITLNPIINEKSCIIYGQKHSYYSNAEIVNIDLTNKRFLNLIFFILTYFLCLVSILKAY